MHPESWDVGRTNLQLRMIHLGDFVLPVSHVNLCIDLGVNTSYHMRPTGLDH